MPVSQGLDKNSSVTFTKPAAFSIAKSMLRLTFATSSMATSMLRLTFANQSSVVTSMIRLTFAISSMATSTLRLTFADKGLPHGDDHVSVSRSQPMILDDDIFAFIFPDS